MSRKPPLLFVIGLTGSIGMGKSTVAAMFRKYGGVVLDSDAINHRLLAAGGKAVAEILRQFPEVASDDKASSAIAVDRQKLSARLMRCDGALAKLEAIMHPFIKAERNAILQKLTRRASTQEQSSLPLIVVIEAPLLFEKGIDSDCQLTVVVSAPSAIQQQRVLARPGMTAAKLDYLLSRQMPSAEKCKRGDIILDSSQSLQALDLQVEQLIIAIRKGEIPH